MIPRDVLEKILTAAAQAPSGSNSQPWRFEVENGIVSIFMLPEKDHLILNFRHRGTILANGALVTNLVIAARYYGFEPRVDSFPSPRHANLIARVSFSEPLTSASSPTKSEPDFFDAIWKRTTNRKPFSTQAIDEDAKKALLAATWQSDERNILLKVTENRGEIEALAQAASTNEVIMFSDQRLHKLFFEELVWTEKEENEKKSGLYTKTMELKPPQAAALHLFKNWSFMNFVNQLGAAKGIAKSNAKGYASCALYGAVLCDNDDHSFLGVGKVIERAWLAATVYGLSFQLQTGVNFLWQRISGGERADDRSVVSPEHAALIGGEYRKMENIFDAKGKFIPVLFRVGYDGQPSARSSKKAPEVIFK